AVRLKVLSAGAVKYVVTDFAPKFTHETGDHIEFTFGTIGMVQKRLQNGETADIVMGTAPAIAQLEQSGVLIAGSRTELGRTLTGICVRADTPMPDISTPDRFKQAMLDARSVAYTSPQAGGFFVIRRREVSADNDRTKTKGENERARVSNCDN